MSESTHDAVANMNTLLAPIRDRVGAYEIWDTTGPHAAKDCARLLAALDAADAALVHLYEHFHEGIDPDNPQGQQHIANSNRAFGAGFALDDFRAAVTATMGGG